MALCQVAALIKSILTAGDIVSEIIREFNQAKKSTDDSESVID